MLLLTIGVALAGALQTSLDAADEVVELEVRGWSCVPEPELFGAMTRVEARVTRSWKGSAVGASLQVVLPGCADRAVARYRYVFTAGERWLVVGARGAHGELSPASPWWWVRRGDPGHPYAESYFDAAPVAGFSCADRELGRALPLEGLPPAEPPAPLSWDALAEGVSTCLIR